MNRLLLPLFAAVLLAGAANATAEEAQSSKAEEAKAAIAAAEKSESEAAASGFEWRDTGTLIQEAKKAEAANDFDKAITLAGQAERQGALAVKQAATETERFKKMK